MIVGLGVINFYFHNYLAPNFICIVYKELTNNMNYVENQYTLYTLTIYFNLKLTMTWNAFCNAIGTGF